MKRFTISNLPLIPGALALACLLAPIATRAQVTLDGIRTILANGFYQPTGVAVDGYGNVFVADSGDNAVKEILAAGGYTTVRILADGFKDPSGVAVDGSGNVYVADTGNNAVKKIVAVHGVIPAANPTIDTLASGFKTPRGVAVDTSEDVYVADTGNSAVKRIAAAGSYTTVRILGGGFNEPSGVAVDRSGNVFVADTGHSAVKEISAALDYSTVKALGSGFSNPHGVAVDEFGNVFVADSSNGVIKEILAASGYATVTYPGGVFGLPEGVAVGAGGSVFIADETDNDVFEVSRSGANFGTQPIGLASAAITLPFVISGMSEGTVAVLTEGSAGKDFAIAPGSPCGPAFSWAEPVCEVNVVFTPTASGLRQGALVFHGDSGKALLTVPLYGVGSGPQVAFPTNLQLSVGTGLNQPTRVAVDGAGDVFIADTGNNRVVKAPAGGGAQTTVGTGLTSPRGVAVDGAGDVYIADSGNDRVVKVPAGGAAQTTVGSGLNAPASVAVDGEGDVFIADSGNRRVVQVYLNGAQTVVGSGWSDPVGVAVDGAGDVFVADQGANRVVELLAGGGTRVAAEDGLNSPRSVAVDGAGDVFIADWGNNRVIEAPAGGGELTIVAGGLNLPRGVTVDGVGDIFIADSSNNRVLELPRSQAPLLSFTGTLVGAASVDSPQTAIIQNVGDQPLKLAGVTYPADFPEAAGAQNSCKSSLRLNAGQVCAVTANFKPLSIGAPSERVTLTDNTLNQTGAQQAIDVKGAGLPGTPGVASLSPAKLGFGSQKAGTTSKAQAILLANKGGSTLTIESIGNNGVFAETNTCGPLPSTLAPGKNCTISVTFAPPSPGEFSETLSVVTSANSTSAAVAGEGTGTAEAQPLLSPNPYNFGYQSPGTTSAPQTFWLFNPTAMPLSIAGAEISVGGYFALSPAQLANTCVPAAPAVVLTLGSGQSCTLQVEFDPPLSDQEATNQGQLGVEVASNGQKALAQLSGTTASRETVINTFTGPNGAHPNGALIADSSGNLFGTTSAGGKYGAGMVYELVYSADGYSEKQLYNFTGKADGGSPVSALVADADGNLFGTTVFGGTGSCVSAGSGCGVVFELVKSSSYKETVLYQFTGGSDGGMPYAPVTLDGEGNLYGAASCGGSTGCAGKGSGNGVVFELQKYYFYHQTVLHTFAGASDGATPLAAVILDAQGNLYGTASGGGGSGTCSATGCGVVFELIQAKAFSVKVLYRFSGETDGGDPRAPVVFDLSGNLYGTAACGGDSVCSAEAGGDGVIFEILKEATTYQVLHAFGGADGASPMAGLTFDSDGASLYGTTYRGGASDLGVVFALSVPDDGLYVLDSAPGGKGSANFASPVFSLQNLTAAGRCTGKCGGAVSLFGGAPNLGVLIEISLEYRAALKSASVAGKPGPQ